MIDMISEFSAPTRNSTAQATANTSMDGLVVVCINGDRSSHPEVGNITLRVIGEYTSSSGVEQMIEASLQCTSLCVGTCISCHILLYAYT